MTALGCSVVDDRGALADPFAFEEDDLLFNSGVETVRVVWHGLGTYCESFSGKNTGVFGLSSAVAEEVSIMQLDWLLSLVLLFLPFSSSLPSEIVHRPLLFGVRSGFGVQASLRSSEECSAGSAIGEDVNSYIFVGDSFNPFSFSLNSPVRLSEEDSVWLPSSSVLDPSMVFSARFDEPDPSLIS